jgi:hypothetical protein
MWIGTLAWSARRSSPASTRRTPSSRRRTPAGEHPPAAGIAQYAYWAVLLGVFVTSFYSFRLLYLTFHGKERFRDAHAHDAHMATCAATHDAHHDER